MVFERIVQSHACCMDWPLPNLFRSELRLSLRLRVSAITHAKTVRSIATLIICNENNKKVLFSFTFGAFAGNLQEISFG
jgi:hypothetical protein